MDFPPPARTPRFAEPLHVGRPNVGDRAALHRRLDAALDRRWLTNDGPLVREFEAALAARLEVRHVVATANATVALEIAARALGLTGEVILPSFTFVATAHALYNIGLTPVFADVSEDTHALDPAAAERLISPQTSAIVGVHLWGRACDVGGLAAVAGRHNLVLMFDAAQAFGATHRGRPVGGNGACEVFSFHATKVCNAFEGGAIATNDDALADQCRRGRNFGFAGYDRVEAAGTNGKMSEASGAMGLCSLESYETFVDANRANEAAYRRGLADLPLRLLSHSGPERSNHHYVVAELDERQSRVTRDELVDALWAENIYARKYFWPGCHRMEPYRTRWPDAGRHLPVTERVARRVVLLPTGTAVTPAVCEEVCDVIRGVLGRPW